MKPTFSTLSKVFRALAVLERCGAVRSVQFWPAPSVSLGLREFKEMFPEAKGEPGTHGTLYHTEVCGMEVTSWEAS